MRVLAKLFVLELCLALMLLLPLGAQTAARATTDENTTSANTTPASQAPDAVAKTITDLVHAGKYAEAQRDLTALLTIYPGDQRLIKAKELLDKLLAPAGSASAPSSNQPTNNVVPATNTDAKPLSGIEKVDYDALIELARQAQQNTDLEQQKASLKQFMNDSSPFLQNHPDEMLLWQLRAASAISLSDPAAGYESGQKLLATDSNDPNLRRLLAQLKNKGWLDKQEAAKQARYIWIFGTWSMHFTWFDKRGNQIGSGNVCQEFTKSGSVVEGYGIDSCDGNKGSTPNFRGRILDSGEISWERLWGSVWRPMTFEIGNDNRTMKLVFTENRSTLTGIYTKK